MLPSMNYEFSVLLFTVCDPLGAPDNGDIDCSLGSDGAANPGDTCTFICDEGFRLHGSVMRICQVRHGEGTSWSGNETRCESGMHRMFSLFCEASLSQLIGLKYSNMVLLPDYCQCKGGVYT